MELSNSLSILIGIAASAPAIALLYGLQKLMAANEADGAKQHVQSWRASRRLAAQQLAEVLRQASEDSQVLSSLPGAGMGDPLEVLLDSELGSQQWRWIRGAALGEQLPASLQFDFTLNEEIVQ